jgi:hypothetical protein
MGLTVPVAVTVATVPIYDVTVYKVMALPPFEAGGLKLTDALAL